METIKYLESETAKVYKARDGEDVLIELLWGDHVEILDPIPQKRSFEGAQQMGTICS